MNQTELLPAEAIDAAIEALATAGKPSEVFKALLEGSRLATPRAAVFLVRQDVVKGWGCVGYDPAVVRHQQAYSTPAGSGWLGELAVSRSSSPALRQGPGGDPDFGQQPSTDSVALPVSVRGRTIALLMAERSEQQTPWQPALLHVLVRVACMRLELDLAMRKIRATASRPADAAPQAPEHAEVAPSVGVPAGATVPDAGTGAITEAPSGGDPRLDAARRFARLVATDIRLYNEEAIVSGRHQRDLLDRIGDQLTRGREAFVRRHGDLGPVGLQILREAYVQVLAGGDESLIPPSAVG